VYVLLRPAIMKRNMESKAKTIVKINCISISTTYKPLNDQSPNIINLAKRLAPLGEKVGKGERRSSRCPSRRGGRRER
jgi:hypothetical protein